MSAKEITKNWETVVEGFKGLAELEFDPKNNRKAEEAIKKTILDAVGRIGLQLLLDIHAIAEAARQAQKFAGSR